MPDCSQTPRHLRYDDGFRPGDDIRIRRSSVSCGVLFGVSVWLLAGCGGAYCGESSESVARARAVSSEDLAEIYRFATGATELKAGRLDQFPNAPKALVALEPSYIRMEPGEAAIYLETCSIDYKVLLVTNHRGADSDFIRLQWGGSPNTRGSEVLWESSDPIGDSPDH